MAFRCTDPMTSPLSVFTLPSAIRYNSCGSLVCAECSDLNCCRVCGEEELFDASIVNSALAWARSKGLEVGQKLPSILAMAEADDKRAPKAISEILFGKAWSEDEEEGEVDVATMVERADSISFRQRLAYVAIQSIDLLP
eukprot:GILI01013007.1.p1 GENE.GILI01013007.1~~GILI01013007.1.p1  ORF type:complete len:140 (-),score=15.43 GILI01013007.1:70-489(-)